MADMQDSVTLKASINQVVTFRVLIACEYSGRVREAFRKLGFDAWSCDLLPSDDNSPYHIQGDVLEVLDNGWDMMIAHPPCTYFASAGLQYLKTQPGRLEKQVEAAEFVEKLLNAPIPKICIENPVGQLQKYIGKPSQIVRMWQFGHAEAHKPTCFWVKGLPLLQPTNVVTPLTSRKYPNGKVLSQWRAKNGNWKNRSVTFQGIADAMSQQWGNDLQDTDSDRQADVNSKAQTKAHTSKGGLDASN